MQRLYYSNYTLRNCISGSKRGHQGHAPPPRSPSFSIMQFSGKNWQNNRLALPPWRLAPPPPHTRLKIVDPPLNCIVLLKTVKFNASIETPCTGKRTILNSFSLIIEKTFCNGKKIKCIQFFSAIH